VFVEVRRIRYSIQDEASGRREILTIIVPTSKVAEAIGLLAEKTAGLSNIIIESTTEKMLEKYVK
jgi:hypothetical protein